MRALTVTPGVKNSIRLDDIDPPTPSSSQALLRVREIGICGTDLDINQGFYGEAPLGSNYLVTGHESLAIVENIPGNSPGISKGDLVVPTVRRPDSCMNCLAGESDMCLTGNYREHGIKRLHGFASEFAVSDVDFLVKVPSKLANVAVLLEPMSVAEKGIYSSTTAPEDIGEFYKDVVLGIKTFFGSVNANISYFRMGLKDFADVENRFNGILRDTISARIPPEEFQKAYAQNKDNIKTVIRFNN